ncbi:MAG: CCA tRNA nucleotidyltransferase [Roseibium sp.]|uniref:CCA tRNA nucleotidyltransferase n=1 Tax=Roseibium sp. TaxID=1936156 RepID=UPI001B073CCD|nr:CCA tRNA nucleotidyltransferase [Roseibium sp.]MBO6894133.1 CCA tRNA nucleotidyltransferase [Roseibium sp.]MBO6930709.1 CCA tRNA nucleotidyltransferase [Roseibium sp.]
MSAEAEKCLQQADWLHAPGIQAVFAALEKGGEQARVVGGAVRNTLLGHPVPDVDIATSAAPNDIVRLASDAGLKPVATGIDHGTVTVISNGYPYEVTSLREDVETFGRQAKVVFGRDWKKDAERRDFTLNALYADRHGQLLDPLGGLDDCLARRVRFIGDPDTRIREDYLRILRFFRIYAAYGEGEMDAAGIGACLRQRDGLRHLSAERIGHEMRRLLSAPLAARALRMMNECGLWEIATGGLARLDAYDALRTLESSATEVRDPELGLLVLAGFVREDLERVSDRFRLSNAERKRMKMGWAAGKVLRSGGDLPSAASLVYDFGRQGALDGTLAFWATLRARNKADDTLFGRLLMDIRMQSVPEFPVKGADLLQSGRKPGPELGDLLKGLEDRWRSSGFTLDKQALLTLAEDMV